MKITLEGTESELRSAIRSFGIPNEVIFDDGEKFVSLEKRRKNCAVTRLDPKTRKSVDTMLLNGCSYNHISQCLKSMGVSISRQAISNYRRNYFQKPMPIKEELIPFNCCDLGYMSDPNSEESVELRKKQTNLYRQLYSFYSNQEKPNIDLDIMAENSKKD